MIDFIFINIMESAVMLAIFYLFYELILKKETFFKTNRVYLLSSLLLSVTIPFLSFSIHLFDNPSINGGIFQSLSEIKSGYNELNAVIIYAYSGKLTWPVIKEYISIIYFIGVLISTVFFILGLIKILFLIKKSSSKKYGRYRIIETKEAIFPFSLFKWIIINPEKYTSEDMEQVIAHEKIHAFQLHSLDLIMIEVLVILFWFNPFIYWYRKSIREVHEYLADQAVVENGFDKLDYQKLLFSQVSGGRFVGLSCRFSYSLSKNRLKMLTMMKSKNISKIKIILLIPVIILAVFFFACNEESLNSKSTLDEVVVIKSVGDNSENINSDEVEGEIYFEADVMAKFNGGEASEFRKYIARKLKYPEAAAKNRISGKVFISFVIDKEGNVKNVKIERGADSDLNDEAIRVVRSSPKWEPALVDDKPVNVQFTFPIVFALQ